MEAGSPLEGSADLWCWCYGHLHFFPFTAPLCVSAPSLRVSGLLFSPLQRAFCFPPPPCLVPLLPPSSPVSYQILAVLQERSSTYKEPISTELIISSFWALCCAAKLLETCISSLLCDALSLMNSAWSSTGSRLSFSIIPRASMVRMESFQLWAYLSQVLGLLRFGQLYIWILFATN